MLDGLTKMASEVSAPVVVALLGTSCVFISHLSFLQAPTLSREHESQNLRDDVCLYVMYRRFTAASPVSRTYGSLYSCMLTTIGTNFLHGYLELANARANMWFFPSAQMDLMVASEVGDGVVAM